MANKTLHEFSAPTTPAVNVGEEGFELKPALINIVTPQVFSSIIALHLHEHKHASFHVILCGCN
jgi:hypothetical protein